MVPSASDTLPRASLGTGTRVWLVRHAAVAEEAARLVYGRLDVPLSDAGRARTEELANDLAALRPALVLGSTLERARLLAERLASLSGARLELSDALVEIDRGGWTNRPAEAVERESGHEVEAFHADPWTTKSHGGECDAEVAERAWPVVERAAATGAGRPVVIVTHYNVIRVLLGLALGLAPKDTFRLRLDTGRCAELVDAPNGWELGPFNVYAPVAAAPGDAP